MRTLLSRLFPRAQAPDTIPPSPDSIDSSRPTPIMLTNRIEYLEAALDRALEQRDQARRELATAQAIIDNPQRAATYWRRQYQQQVRNNAELDDRLAAAEGRPVTTTRPDASGRPGGRAHATQPQGAQRV